MHKVLAALVFAASAGVAMADDVKPVKLAVQMTEAQMEKVTGGCYQCDDAVANRNGTVSQTTNVQGFSRSSGAMDKGLSSGRGAFNAATNCSPG